MPQLVAERVQPPVIVTGTQLVPGIQIGDVGELAMLEPALDTVIARRLDVAEQAAAGEQPVVIERLP